MTHLSDYQHELVKAWEGELFGEALMSSLEASLLDLEQHAEKIRQIKTVELLMGRLLERLIDEPDIEDIRASANARAKVVADGLKCWADVAARVLPTLDEVTNRFKQLAAGAPPPHRSILNLLVEHEEALSRFFEFESNGGMEQNHELDAITIRLVVAQADCTSGNPEHR